MRRGRLRVLCITLILSLFLTSCGIGNNLNDEDSSAKVEYEDIFKEDSITDIKIDISEEDWKSILENPTAEEYHSADVTVNGVKVENVGFRTKGNITLSTTAQSDSDRYSFRIKFDKYVDNQELCGLDELVVNNMLFDPSYMREYLTYEAFSELGVDVPLSVFSNVYINDELYGFYLCIEAPDDSYLERVFGDNDGNLYKADRNSTLTSTASLNTLDQKNGKDKSKEDLASLIEILNAMPSGEKGEIESILDVDSVLKYIAVNSVLANEDSYLGSNSHNYYLYNNNGKFSMIPWDYNTSFGTGMTGGTFGINSTMGNPNGGMGGQRPDDTDFDPSQGGEQPNKDQNISPPEGKENMTPPEDFENMTPPEEMENIDPENNMDNKNIPMGGKGGGGNTSTLVSTSVTSPVFSVDESQRPLVSKLLAVPEYNEKYLEYINKLTEYLESLNTRIPQLAEVIKSNIESDPTNFYTIEQFETQVTGTDVTSILGFAQKRLENIKLQLEDQ